MICFETCNKRPEKDSYLKFFLWFSGFFTSAVKCFEFNTRQRYPIIRPLKMPKSTRNCQNLANFHVFTIFVSFFQTCPMKGRPEDSFMEQFSERFMDHVRQVCTFAKLIPGFKCLHHDDQVTLLKSCVFEVLLVRLAGLFDSQVCTFPGVKFFRGQIFRGQKFPGVKISRGQIFPGGNMIWTADVD